jgi:hypothetical protein
MQRTRLNTLVEVAGTRLSQFFTNPWRRTSLVLLGLLFGMFIGQAVSTTSGQAAAWDVIASGLLVLLTELISRWVYTRRRTSSQGLLLADVLNCFKIGIAYSLYLEAFKLGS